MIYIGKIGFVNRLVEPKILHPAFNLQLHLLRLFLKVSHLRKKEWKDQYLSDN